jgi:predicted CopG family antitoxin
MDFNDFFSAEANSADFEEFEKACAEDAKRFSDAVVEQIAEDAKNMDVFMRMFGFSEADAFKAVMRSVTKPWNTGFEKETVFKN